MFNGARRQVLSLADFSAGGVVFELEHEQFESQRTKTSEGRVTRVPISEFGVRSSEFKIWASWNSALRKHGFTQSRGEV